MTDVILTAALTGPFATKDQNPGLPTTPEEIAEAAAAAYDAGAAVAHVHLRDRNGQPCADLGIARRTIELVQERSPILVQLSTGVGPLVPFEVREKLVEVNPSLASLSVASMTFGNYEFRNPPNGVKRLASRMCELGIKPEVEIYDTGHVSLAVRLIEEGLLLEPVQFSIVMGVGGGMPATPEALLATVSLLPPSSIWQVIAVGRHHLPLAAVALALGGNARTGLEDTLMIRRGVLASSNAELVTQLVNLCEAMERKPATVSEAARILGLPTNAAL